MIENVFMLTPAL